MQDCFFSVEMIYCIFFHLSKQQNEISLSSGSGRDKILKNDWSGHSVFICYFLVVSFPGNWSCCLRLCFWSPQGHCRLCPAGLGCGREVGCCQSLPGTAPSPDLCCGCTSLWISSYERVQAALHSQTDWYWDISFSARRCFPLSSIKAPAGESIDLTPFRGPLDTCGMSSQEWEFNAMTKNYMAMEKPFS